MSSLWNLSTNSPKIFQPLKLKTVEASVFVVVVIIVVTLVVIVVVVVLFIIVVTLDPSQELVDKQYSMKRVLVSTFL